MKEKNIIQVVHKDPTSFVDAHIAMVTGQQLRRKGSYFLNTETGEKYLHIAGSIAWPGKTQKAPGCTLVGAVTREKYPKIKLLDMAEDHHVEGLVRAGIRRRQKYGFSVAPDILRIWYGDYGHFETFMAMINNQLLSAGSKNSGFYLAEPVDFEMKNRFEIYMRRIRACLVKLPGKGKRLEVNLPGMRTRIKSLDPDEAVKALVTDFPTIAALGYLLHSLLVYQPWMLPVAATASASWEDYATKYEHDQRQHEAGAGGPGTGFFAEDARDMNVMETIH